MCGNKGRKFCPQNHLYFVYMFRRSAAQAFMNKFSFDLVQVPKSIEHIYPPGGSAILTGPTHSNPRYLVLQQSV